MLTCGTNTIKTLHGEFVFATHHGMPLFAIDCRPLYPCNSFMKETSTSYRSPIPSDDPGACWYDAISWGRRGPPCGSKSPS